MVIQRAYTPAPTPRAATPAPADLPVSSDTLALSEHVAAELKTKVAGALSPGDVVSIEMADGRKLVVEGPGGPAAQNWVGNIKDFVAAGAQEVAMAVNAGPNLALTGITEAVKPAVLQGVPDDVSGYVNNWYTPAVRGLSIAISLKKFWDRWHNNQTKAVQGQALSTWDKVGTVADGLHILTSTAGLLGSVAGALVPSLKAVGATAVGVAVAGDVGSFAVNGLEYLDWRSKVHILPEPDPEPDPEPAPTPTPPPSSPRP